MIIFIEVHTILDLRRSLHGTQCIVSINILKMNFVPHNTYLIRHCCSLRIRPFVVFIIILYALSCEPRRCKHCLICLYIPRCYHFPAIHDMCHNAQVSAHTHWAPIDKDQTAPFRSSLIGVHSVCFHDYR